MPLIMKWTGHIPEGECRSQVVNLVDLSATLVDAGQGPQLPNADGQSLLPLAIDGATEWQNETYSEYCTDGLLAWSGGRVLQSRMVRCGKWKFNYYHNCPHQLFDLEADPDEMNNLIDDPDCQKVASEMREKVFDWLETRMRSTTQSSPGNGEKAILKAWAQSVKPADKYRWETRAEDNLAG